MRRPNCDSAVSWPGNRRSVRVIEDALAGAASAGQKPDVLSVAAYFNPGKEGLYEAFLDNGPDVDRALVLMRAEHPRHEEKVVGATREGGATRRFAPHRL